jgi:hypothetical protein
MFHSEKAAPTKPILIPGNGNESRHPGDWPHIPHIFPRQFALPSPDSTRNEAQAINFPFYALGTCDS